MSEIKIEGAVEVLQGNLIPGDMVYPVRKQPEKVLEVRDSDGDVSTDHEYYNPRNYRFFLVSRAEVELPEVVGSVIRVKGFGGGAVTWLLMPAGRWVSQDEVALDAEALRKTIASSRLSVEVL